MNIKQLLYGIATCVPGFKNLRIRGTGGTISARYCYSVWMRHLVMAKENGLNTSPSIVAELGPGDSLGIGLAALIGGCDRYFAFDIVKFANNKRNLEVFDQILQLFNDKEPIPDDQEFPRAKPYLTNYSFPEDIFDDARLERALDYDRISKIRNSITSQEEKNAIIQYKVPWDDTGILEGESADMIYSQAVLEHVDELENAYRTMWLWLKKDGYISHQIDFKCHGTAKEWNGHWAFSDFVWKLFRGKRPYLINRTPHSKHLEILNEEKFKVVCDKTITSPNKLRKEDLARDFREMTDQDLGISGAFLQAVKTE